MRQSQVKEQRTRKMHSRNRWAAHLYSEGPDFKLLARGSHASKGSLRGFSEPLQINSGILHEIKTQ